jgi:hypothetical protein
VLSFSARWWRLPETASDWQSEGWLYALTLWWQ